MQIRELGHVVLYVSSLEKLADFYEKTLGFKQIVREWPMAMFSSGRTHHELLLIEVGGVSDHPRGRPQTPGLYHIGFKVADSTEELKGVYKELKEKKVPMLGTTDHGVYPHSICVLARSRRQRARASMPTSRMHGRLIPKPLQRLREELNLE